MPDTIIDLGKKVKAKYPGQYDDLTDADVGRKVKAKYPTEYADFADAPASNPALDAIRAQQSAKYPSSQQLGKGGSGFGGADDRTAMDVAVDQGEAARKGVIGGLLAVPKTAAGVADAMWHITKGQLGVEAPQVGIQKVKDLAAGVASMPGQVLQPIAQSIAGAQDLMSGGRAGLFNPELGDSYADVDKVQDLGTAPDNPEWPKAAENAGNQAGALIGADVLAKLPVNGAVAKLQNAKLPGLDSITSSPELNRWLNVTPKAMEHGANPAERILSDGLLASSKEATQANVQAALKSAGNEMETALYDATQSGAPKVDARPIIDNGINNIQKKIGNPKDSTFQSTLTSIKSDISNAHPNMDALPPKQLQGLIQHLGDSINWSSAVENPVNDAMIDIYKDLRNAQAKQVPDLQPLLSKWQDLYVGNKSIYDSLLKDQAGVGTGGSLGWNKLKSIGKKAAVATGTAYGFNKLMHLVQ